MALGRRKHGKDEADEVRPTDALPETPGGDDLDHDLDGRGDDLDGPFDITDFEDAAVATVGRHDLGSVLIPENDTAETVFEVNQQGVPSAVWMVTPNGRYNVTAWAAPKTGGLWREVVTEIADSLRNDNAQVSIEDGPWGREVVGHVTSGPEPVVMRFIGVDGYRWMVRGAAVGPPHLADQIAAEVRRALADTVIRRGDTPQPVRAMLPLQLSDSLVSRLRARAEQMVADQAQPVTPDPMAPPEPAARRSEQGSAMQQLRTITGG
ncbi:DUF3710 domain-containing protein [Mycolicibacterium sediminis]|uniref:DUF3710 domain-containing protein n=1 Tax=Mycolicibacterium sediminis TaxID=1286180 RepID=A0A7I7QU40_9MYCO|nr:DUF3710 domain-containing protein [Mycolicibacterium sediminis]BBY29497.1 hypothetical protein MSEDJ_35930 [Mycolicibacterium sediminis]